MIRNRSTYRTAVLALLGLAALAALVAPAEAAEIRPETWNDRVQELEEMLVAGRFRKARSLSEKLVEEMAQGLTTGEAADRAMGTALAQLALAEAGIGKEDAALWHWGLALSFRPDLAAPDLAPYGAAGQLLERRREDWQAPEAGLDPEAALARARSAEGATPPLVRYEDLEGVEAKPPRKLSPASPQATAGLRLHGQPDLTILTMVITPEGRLRSPRVVKHSFPGWAYTIAETARKEWRFSPADVEGEPVEVLYTLTIQWQP